MAGVVMTDVKTERLNSFAQEMMKKVERRLGDLRWAIMVPIHMSIRFDPEEDAYFLYASLPYEGRPLIAKERLKLKWLTGNYPRGPEMEQAIDGIVTQMMLGPERWGMQS